MAHCCPLSSAWFLQIRLGAGCTTHGRTEACLGGAPTTWRSSPGASACFATCRLCSGQRGSSQGCDSNRRSARRCSSAANVGDSKGGGSALGAHVDRCVVKWVSWRSPRQVLGGLYWPRVAMIVLSWPTRQVAVSLPQRGRVRVASVGRLVEVGADPPWGAHGQTAAQTAGSADHSDRCSGVPMRSSCRRRSTSRSARARRTVSSLSIWRSKCARREQTLQEALCPTRQDAVAIQSTGHSLRSSKDPGDLAMDTIDTHRTNNSIPQVLLAWVILRHAYSSISG